MGQLECFVVIQLCPGLNNLEILVWKQQHCTCACFLLCVCMWRRDFEEVCYASVLEEIKIVCFLFAVESQHWRSKKVTKVLCIMHTINAYEKESRTLCQWYTNVEDMLSFVWHGMPCEHKNIICKDCCHGLCCKCYKW